MTMSELGDLFLTSFHWIELVMSAGMFYICLQRFQVKRKTTVEFWQTLVLGLFFLSQGIFGFLPRVPKGIRIGVDVAFVLCMLAILFMYFDRLRQDAPR